MIEAFSMIKSIISLDATCLILSETKLDNPRISIFSLHGLKNIVNNPNIFW